MKLDLYRFSAGKEDTLGLMFIDCNFECFTLEDEYRSVKVKGETRIPAGTYSVKFREIETGKTIRYKNKFAWFTWHLELQDVPNFKYIYIHLGNDSDDTEGCILLGKSSNNIMNSNNQRTIGTSTAAFEIFYKKVQKELHAGNTVTITVRDAGQWTL